MNIGFILSADISNLRYTQFILELAEELSHLKHNITIFSSHKETTEFKQLPVEEIPITNLDYIVVYSVAQLEVCSTSPAKNKVFYFVNPVEAYKNNSLLKIGGFKLLAISSGCKILLERSTKVKGIKVLPGSIGKACIGYNPGISKGIGITTLVDYDYMQGGSVAQEAISFSRSLVDNISVVTTNYLDIWDWYNKSILYVTATSLIGFDFCSLEALYCGCCVVSTFKSDFLTNKNSVLSKGDAYHLSRNIVEVLQNGDLRLHLRKNGLTINNTSQFSIETITNNFLKLIQ